MNNNLIELIGIIEGINYDGVINEMEIDKLNEWLSHNRQYKSDSVFNRVIKMLDRILEDNIITSSEKKELIDYAHLYYRDNHNVNDSLTILNGIVEGIICDDVINQYEIEELRSWLSSNDFLKGNRTYDKILSLIQRVLEDNILTKDEQQQLFALFESEIFDSKTDIKINFLKKKVRLRKNIGIELIELINDKKMINRIHNAALIQLKQSLRSYSGTVNIDNELVFISLVLIALLQYDANFYGHVEDTYSELYDIYSPQKINGQIRSIISKFRRGSGDHDQRIINYILMNSIVPKHFLPNFFEFMFDIYKINFNYSLDEDLYDSFKFIYEGLKGSLNHDTDDLSLSATKKTYKLIKSTKSLVLLGQGLEEIINLSINVIKMIDKHYWDEELPLATNVYYKYGYDKWIEANEKREKLKKSKGERRQTFAQKWGPTFKIKGNDIIIVPPAHKIKNTHDYSKIAIEVLNEDDLIYRNDKPIIHEIIGGYQVVLEEIIVSNPLGRLRYVITEDETIIYDSKESLYREYIMFTINGNELKNNTNYVGDVFICDKFPKNKELQTYYETSYYKLDYASVNEDTIFSFGNVLINFVSEMKPGLIADKLHDVYLKYDIFKTPIYKTVKFLVFESSLSIDKIGIRINNTRKKLSEMRVEQQKKDLYTKYIVELNINECGIYSISAFQISSKKALKGTQFEFAIDKELEFEKQKLDDDNYVIKVTSEFKNVTNTYDLIISDFDRFDIPVRCNGKQYSYILPLEIPMYKIDNGIWMNIDSYIWIDDIKAQSMIYLNGIKATELFVYDSNDEVLGSVLLDNRKDYLTCQISSLRTYKLNHDYVELALADGDEEINCITCYNKCLLNENKTDFIFNPVLKILDMKVSYIGKGNVYVMIKDRNGELVFEQKVEYSGEIIRTNELQSFEPYEITIYEKNKGLSIKNKRIMKTYKQIFYAYEDLVGKRFKIDSVDFDQNIHNKFKRVNYNLKKTYLVLTNKTDDLTYEGNIYQLEKDNHIRLFKHNPVEVELTSDPYDNSIEASVTKDGDGLLMDFSRRSISNNLEDKKGIDIFSYFIDLKGAVS